MNVEIGGRAKALDERDGAAVGLAAFESRLFDQISSRMEAYRKAEAARAEAS